MDSPEGYDLQIDVIALGYATRQLLGDLDRETIIDRALESLADFGRSDTIGLWFLDQPGEKLIFEAGIVSHNQVKQALEMPVAGSPCEEVLDSKKPAAFPLVRVESLPWPVAEAGIENRECLCAPLLAADNQPIGVVTFDRPAEDSLTPVMMLPLIVLLTVVAMALETSRLFNLAVIDGLTQLYVRRYFELRLAEEETRLKRYGGSLALLVTDIDHFKKFNDTYGHQQGDVVLREVAALMKEAARKEVDVVCRYGGEEFVVIMPNTDVEGALVVAERIRARVAEYPFPGQDKPLHVTLSGGVAVMEQGNLIPGADLFHQADQALYQAKDSGRNRIELWVEED